jgi:hypothetical protein
MLMSKFEVVVVEESGVEKVNIKGVVWAPPVNLKVTSPDDADKYGPEAACVACTLQLPTPLDFRVALPVSESTYSK